MRVAFPYSRSPKEYDPARITLGPEYIFLENIYSPLIEIDIMGAVSSGVASRFEWIGNDAVFTIRKGVRTIDGYEISAIDAAMSLKRILVLSGNTHGNIQDLLCRGKNLNSLQDDCPGISIDGNKLVLKPGKRKPFLFPMLAAIDFAVIPAPSIDLETLAIKDYRNTSGPYYVSEDAANGLITLSANPNHYHYSDRIAQQVRLIPMNPDQPLHSIAALESGEIDLITTIDSATAEDVLAFYNKNPDRFELHKTLDTRNIILGFTERGQQLFTAQERRYIGRRMRELFHQHFAASVAYKPATQLFPIFGEGGLSESEIDSLNATFVNAPESKLSGTGLKATIVRLALKDEFTRILSQILPGIKVEEGQSPAFIDYSKNPDEMPAMYIAGPDTSYLEDIGLISYSMSSGDLNVPENERADWLATYGDIEKKEDRIAMLRKVHYETMMEPIIVPLAVSPYIALATNDWKIGLSKLYANNQLWLINRR